MATIEKLKAVKNIFLLFAQEMDYLVIDVMFCCTADATFFDTKNYNKGRRVQHHCSCPSKGLPSTKKINSLTESNSQHFSAKIDVDCTGKKTQKGTKRI